MRWYELVKFVHFMGLIAVAGFFIIYSRAGPRLRAATDMKEVRVWLGLLEVARPMMPGGAMMLILSGLVMGWMRWRGLFPFMIVGLVTLGIAWATSARAGGRHLRAMRAAATAESGAVPPELARVIGDPGPWSAMLAINLAVIGVILIMTLKLGWIAAPAVVVALGALGLLVGRAALGRERR